MSRNYLIIVSEDPYEMPTARRAGELALQLKHRGHRVALFLVQNGVLASRRGANGDAFTAAIGADVEILADDFSLRERGIEFNQLRSGISSAPIDAVVDRLASGWNTLWS